MNNPPALRHSPITLAALAREVAREINELPDILQHFTLTQAEYDGLLQNNSFQAMLKSAQAEWKSAENAEQRLKVQALAGLEDVLPTVVARMAREQEPLREVVEAGKLLKSIANVGEGSGAKSGERFIININLGETEEKHVVDITPRRVDEVSEIQSLPEGEAALPVIRCFPEGTGPSS